jgi:WbqC-like protein family
LNRFTDPGGAGGRRVAIIQSNYIPWKGYFDIINLVDEFILYDDRQYTRRDWRNRNLIKTDHGLRWLTIPVRAKGRYDQRIDETMISDPAWPDRHWKALEQAYSGAPHFRTYRDAIGELYAHSGEGRLSEVNRRFLESISRLLEIETKFTSSTDYRAEGERTARLVSLCRQAGASEYLSGPAGRAYIEEGQFEEAGIGLTYMDYSGYPEYPQLHGSFEHGVSIIDLLFNVGPNARRFMKSFGAGVASR